MKTMTIRFIHASVIALLVIGGANSIPDAKPNAPVIEIIRIPLRSEQPLVTWSAGEGQADKYSVYVDRLERNDISIAKNISFRLNLTVPGKKYTIQMKSSYNGISSDFSNAMEAASRPSKPTVLSFKQTSSTESTVVWKAGSGEADNYKCYYNYNGKKIEQTKTKVEEFRIPLQNPGKNFEIWLIANTETSSYEVFSKIEYATIVQKPTAPVIGSIKPWSSTYVVVIWTAGKGQADKYSVYIDGNEISGINIQMNTNFHLKLPAPAPGRKYNVQMKSSSFGVLSDFSDAKEYVSGEVPIKCSGNFEYSFAMKKCFWIMKVKTNKDAFDTCHSNDGYLATFKTNSELQNAMELLRWSLKYPSYVYVGGMKLIKHVYDGHLNRYQKFNALFPNIHAPTSTVNRCLILRTQSFTKTDFYFENCRSKHEGLCIKK